MADVRASLLAAVRTVPDPWDAVVGGFVGMAAGGLVASAFPSPWKIGVWLVASLAFGGLLGTLRRIADAEADDGSEASEQAAEVGDAATEWGQPRVEWTWGVRSPDGEAHLAPWSEKGRSEDVVRREFAPVVENMGYRKVLLRRTVGAWCEVDESPEERHD